MALGTVLAHLHGPTSLTEVRFVLFTADTLAAYQQALADLVAAAG